MVNRGYNKLNLYRYLEDKYIYGPRYKKVCRRLRKKLLIKTYLRLLIGGIKYGG